MESILLAGHVLAGILFIGPVAVTASLFPRFAPISDSSPAGDIDEHLHDRDRAIGPTVVASDRSIAVARLLARITRAYGRIALVVPVLGLILAAVQGRLTEIWILLAMVLTAVAGALLALRIAPMQQEALSQPDDGSRLRSLRPLTGMFNLLWAVVVILMIVRPGASS